MKPFHVIYTDIYENERTATHSAVRFYVEESGALLIIGDNDKVEAAYAHKVWRTIV